MKHIHTLEDFLKLKEKAHNVTFDRFSGNIAFLMKGAEEILIYTKQGELNQQIDVDGKWVNAILYHRDLNEPLKDHGETLYVGGAFFGKIGGNGQIEEILHSHEDSKNKVFLENGENFFDTLFDGLIYGMCSNGNFVEFEHDNDLSMRVLYHPSENNFYIGQSMLQKAFKIDGEKALAAELPGFAKEEIEKFKEHYGTLLDK